MYTILNLGQDKNDPLEHPDANKTQLKAGIDTNELLVRDPSVQRFHQTSPYGGSKDKANDLDNPRTWAKIKVNS